MLHRLLPIAFITSALYAGTGNAATLVGQIMEDGEILENVEVKLVNDSDGVILHTKYSTPLGTVTFSVKPGVYSVGAFKDEYSPTWLRKIKIDSEEVLINLEMVPEAFTENSVSESDDCE